MATIRGQLYFPVYFWLFSYYLSGSAVAAPPEKSSIVGFAKLEGDVGFTSGFGGQAAFDAKTVRAILDKARSQKCDCLILEIESGGGSVRVGEAILDELQSPPAKAMKLVAWYGVAGSAASWIPFACPTAIAKESSSCGGSVMYSVGADGKLNAVDAKMASFTIARVKNAASAVKRSPILVDAIFDQPKEVWIDEIGMLADARPVQNASSWRCIDTAGSVLNMDTQTALKVGFACGTATDRAGAARIAGVNPAKWVELTSIATDRAKALDAKDKRCHKAIRTWFTHVDEMTALVQEAIAATFETASHYEAEEVPSGDVKVLGKRARDRLNAHMKKLRDNAGLIDFDSDLQAGHPLLLQFQSGHGAMQEKINDRVKEIKERLAEHSTKKAVVAERESKRIFAELKEFLRTLQRPF
jgi:hypothetical protein